MTDAVETFRRPTAETDAAFVPVTVPIRHWGRLISGGLLLALLVAMSFVISRSQQVEWGAIPTFLFSTPILNGIWITLQLTFWSMVIGTILGVLIASMRMSGDPVFIAIAAFYTWLFRGTPLLVQIFFWFNIALFVPELAIGPYSVSVNAIITAWLAGLLALSLHEGANMAEIVRGGLLSVEAGQLDAAKALGLTRAEAMRRIILPQAVKVIIPPTGNQAIGMLKGSASVSVIGTHDLLTQAQNIYARNYMVIELLCVAAIWYLVLTTIASIGQHYIERYFQKSGAGPSPFLSRLRRNFSLSNLVKARS